MNREMEGFAGLELRMAGDAKTIAVAGARGEQVFAALAEAGKRGIASFRLFGDREEIRRYMTGSGLKEGEIVHCSNDQEACDRAVDAVAEGSADLLMKGKVPTPLLLKTLLNRRELNPGHALLSHCLVLEKPGGGFLGISDGGMVMHPGVEEKRRIIGSSVDLFHALGIPRPRVALLSATEQVNEKLPESTDADLLTRAWEEGDFPRCIVQGPMALDLAVSRDSCEAKGYEGKIQGDADILIAPDITAGNALGKALIYLAGYAGGGLILGAKAPVILLSRSDSAREKLNSILLGLTAAAGGNTQEEPG
ncbi:phosphate acyltransferase [Salinispira pacifica]|uniref:Phosphotransbutyrylase n=1 Tax=Salinispira pacifica TaxID=1307761 RepID=V5WGT0_9SPIO|nr:phosphate acyltransferase [Salinispira pacifica]AHC14376.1 phosphotransbutyrylase [Salinispira pacifica]